MYVGRLEKRKGVIYLLKAYARVAKKRDDVELVIAGKGELMESLKSYVRQHNVPNVRFLGFVTEQEKLDLLHQATVFCSPALYGESFGIVLLEAMASGTVTVAGNNPGYSGVLNGAGQQSLVSPKQLDEFAHKLDTMLDDQDIRKAWVAWAKKDIQQYDYKKVVDQYEKVYKQALKARKDAA